MKRSWILALLVLVVGCVSHPAGAQAPASSPSPAILALRDQFEREVLAIEPRHTDDIGGLQVAAVEIAARVYGQDWEAVRAEARRSLAALPVIDLSAYESAKRSPSAMPEFGAPWANLKTRDGLAMLRFWDAAQVAMVIGAAASPIVIGDESAAAIGIKLQLVPPRAYRGSFRGRDVLVSRYYRSLVAIPFTLTAEGMILPDLPDVEVFPVRP